MANLKELKNRIASVTATRKITKAMQMVASAKLRRAQEAATQARPYAQRMDKVLGHLVTRIADPEGASKYLVGTGNEEKHLLIVMTSERGLCGGFNSSIAKLARIRAQKLLAEGKTVKVLTVGRKGADALRRDFGELFHDEVELKGIKRLEFSHAEGISQTITSLFEDGGIDVATLYFARFKSVISQIPTELQLIPAKIDNAAEKNPDSDGSSMYEYEPDEGVVFDYLLKRNIATQIFRGLLENAASEQGARMSAMDNATRNAGEMIDKLTISYNRQRQANITKELIEIISGAEAL